MEWLILWIGLSVIAAVIAANKGRSAIGFFFLAILLSPIIGILAAFIVQPNTARIEDDKLAGGETRRCQHCAEIVRSEARICKHCGRELVPLETNHTEEQWDRFVATLEKRPKTPPATGDKNGTD